MRWLCKVVELAEGGFVINRATLFSFILSWDLLHMSSIWVYRLDALYLSRQNSLSYLSNISQCWLNAGHLMYSLNDYCKTTMYTDSLFLLLPFAKFWRETMPSKICQSKVLIVSMFLSHFVIFTLYHVRFQGLRSAWYVRFEWLVLPANIYLFFLVQWNAFAGNQLWWCCTLNCTDLLLLYCHCFTILHCFLTLHSTAIVLHCSAVYCTILHCNTQHCTAIYNTKIYCTSHCIRVSS